MDGLYKPMKTIAPENEIKLWATVLSLAANHEADKQRGKGLSTDKNKQERRQSDKAYRVTPGSLNCLNNPLGYKLLQ